MAINNTFSIIGVMSGTSLDGLDLALCKFLNKRNHWHYEIVRAKTVVYPPEWKEKLVMATHLNSLQFTQLDNSYGKYIGDSINAFIKEIRHKIDFIASHGHTIFHQPENRLTRQIGNGAFIAATTGITTISDFRTLDVALGGQGAPLVPIGDKLLFSDYDYCLNLGGFANISFNRNNSRIAYDICPANIIINYLVKSLNLEYDKDGALARKGKIKIKLLTNLNRIEYYKSSLPKSLGREWLEEKFIPVINNSNCSIEDKLRTIYEHIAVQISKSVSTKGYKKILLTGGGTYNKYMVELIAGKTTHTLVVPDKTLVDFKESLIFAFLGLLRYRNEINCLSSVTGATRDNCGGAIYRI
ncbi:MAG: anhydro-N-acetylmuramic acid kinase [Bacteroidia bacterium]|nr:anhydro-N-acetylmuramic acid kinase [Bacteroidia bacterium]